jgi:hypothetical protein
VSLPREAAGYFEEIYRVLHQVQAPASVEERLATATALLHRCAEHAHFEPTEDACLYRDLLTFFVEARLRLDQDRAAAPP